MYRRNKVDEDVDKYEIKYEYCITFFWPEIVEEGRNEDGCLASKLSLDEGQRDLVVHDDALQKVYVDGHVFHKLNEPSTGGFECEEPVVDYFGRDESVGEVALDASCVAECCVNFCYTRCPVSSVLDHWSAECNRINSHKEPGLVIILWTLIA